MTVHVTVNSGGTAGSSPAAGGLAHGVVFIHACSRALSPHLEWALARVFGKPVGINWADQPIEPGAVRAEIIWQGPVGSGAKIASALLALKQVRHEVTEDPSPGRSGERFAATPTLGLFRADIGENGDVMVSETRLRTAISQSNSAGDLAGEVARLIGAPWDEELEPYRCSQEGSTVRALHAVG